MFLFAGHRARPVQRDSNPAERIRELHCVVVTIRGQLLQRLTYHRPHPRRDVGQEELAYRETTGDSCGLQNIFVRWDLSFGESRTS